MQRAAEMALDVTVDKSNWSIDCDASGYTDGAPSSDAAIALADKGYYLLSCRSSNDRILDVMAPYGKLTTFMHLLVLIGITFYFVTSSDSGSYVDDIISAQGHENPPWIQRVYWAVTEAATAQALLYASDDGLSTIQGVSIVAGLPYTIAICYCCTSLYRALKREMRDEDIMAQRHGFVVSSLDILELYSPEGMPRAIAVERRLGSNRTSSPCSSHTKVSRPPQSPRTTTMLWVQSTLLLLLARGSPGFSACAYLTLVKVLLPSRGCCTSSSLRKLRLFVTRSERREASEITS